MAGSFYAPIFMSMFLRPRLRKKIEVTGGHGGRLRPFKAKVKLWVSKFIYLHEYSVIGLKHNFEAVFEAVRGCFVILKPVKGLQKEINFWHPSSVPILFWLFKLTEVLPCEFRPFWHIIHTCRGFVVISVEIRGGFGVLEPKNFLNKSGYKGFKTHVEFGAIP